MIGGFRQGEIDWHITVELERKCRDTNRGWEMISGDQRVQVLESDGNGRLELNERWWQIEGTEGGEAWSNGGQGGNPVEEVCQEREKTE